MNPQINAIVSILTRPNQTIREIVANTQNYLVAAIAILVVSSFFFIRITADQPDPTLSMTELGYVWDVQYQAESFGRSIFWNVLSIVIVFYLGMKLGGSKDFRKVFSVMSFVAMPVLVGGIILHIFFMYPFLLENITGIDRKSAEFAGLFWLLYFASIPFAFWTLILSIKAIKIVNNFGTAKALGILFASAGVTYLANAIVMLAL